MDVMSIVLAIVLGIFGLFSILTLVAVCGCLFLLMRVADLTVRAAERMDIWFKHLFIELNKINEDEEEEKKPRLPPGLIDIDGHVTYDPRFTPPPK